MSDIEYNDLPTAYKEKVSRSVWDILVAGKDVLPIIEELEGNALTIEDGELFMRITFNSKIKPDIPGAITLVEIIRNLAVRGDVKQYCDWIIDKLQPEKK